MNLLKIIPQAILCFIAFLAIIIRLGWKHLNKYIPVIAPNKKWSKNCVLVEIVALVVLLYFLNVWFWSDYTETGSDFWIMSNPVGAFEQRFSIAKQIISKKPFAFFNETINSLPDGIEEIQKMIDFAKTIDASKMEAFVKWLNEKKCDEADMTKLEDVTEAFEAILIVIMENCNNLATTTIWGALKNKMKYEPTEYENESKLYKGYSDSIINFLENIMHHFKDSENDFRKGMLQTTENENNKIKKIYLIPSAIIFLFSLLSIYTTKFNPQMQLSRVSRFILTLLFYALTIQVIIILIYELNTDSSSVCHLKSENFRPYDFKSEYKDETSTENMFANCTYMRTSILSSPNDKIFMPETTYVEIVRERFLNDTVDLIKRVQQLRKENEQFKRRLDDFLKPMIEVKSTCFGINVHINSVEQFIVDHMMFFVEHKIKFENHVTMAERIINDKIQNFSKVINDPIQTANKLINATNFDCNTMFNAYQHGYNRSCFLINSEIILILTTFITIFSVLCAVIHLLNLRKKSTLSSHRTHINAYRQMYEYNHVDFMLLPFEKKKYKFDKLYNELFV